MEDKGTTGTQLLAVESDEPLIEVYIPMDIWDRNVGRHVGRYGA